MAGIGRIYPLPTPGISLISLNYLVSYGKKNNTFLKGFTNLEGKLNLGLQFLLLAYYSKSKTKGSNPIIQLYCK